MENLSHSRQPNKVSHATVTKRTCNGSKLAGKTAYDDVFGGPPRFGAPTLSPRPEDYSEIFGGFHTSRATSIPVLDLPLVEEEDVFFDVRSSGFDYGEVFGGFNELDFAASFEELIKQSDGTGDRDRDGEVNGDPSEEAWTPAETESLSDDSDHSGNYQYSLYGETYEPINCSMEFSISYHKAVPRSNGDLSNGITHDAELHGVPEYTYIVDKTTPLQKMENKNAPLFVSGDDKAMVKGKHLRKTMSHPPKGTASQQSFTNDLMSQREYRRAGSLSNEMFVTISEISLKTQPSGVPPPSRPPPILDVKRSDHQKRQTSTSKGTADDNSPPFFDVEIDATSAAVASAAKDAMEKAQAKLKSAKELMERKRDGVASCPKPVSKCDVKDKKENLSKAVDGSNNIKGERQGASGREGSGMRSSFREERQKVKKSDLAFSDSVEGEKVFSVAVRSAEKHGKEFQSQVYDKVDEADEWQEATEFFELVRTDKLRSTFEQANNSSSTMHNPRTHEHQQKAEMPVTVNMEQHQGNGKKVKAEDYQLRRTDDYLMATKNACASEREGSIERSKAEMAVTETMEQHLGNVKKVKAEEHQLRRTDDHLKTTKDALEREGSIERSKAAKEARSHKINEKKVRAAAEVSEQEEDVNKSRVVPPLENGKKHFGVNELEKHETRVKSEQKENKIGVEQAMKTEQQQEEARENMETQKRVKESPERLDGDKKQREVHEREENATKFEQALEKAEDEERLTEARQLEEKEKWLREIREREQNEKKEGGDHELEESEMIWRKALEQLENEKRPKQVLAQEGNENIHIKALEQEELQDKETDTHKKEENEKMSMRVPEQEAVKKQPQRACGKEGIEKRLKQAHRKEKTERELNEACEKWTEMKLEKNYREKDKTENRQEDAFEQKFNSKMLKDPQDGEQEAKEAFGQEEMAELKGANEERWQPERNEIRKKVTAQTTHQQVEGEDLEVFYESHKLDNNRKCLVTPLARNLDESCDELEQTQETFLEENLKVESECRHGEKKSEATEKGNVDEKFNISSMEDVTGLCHPDAGMKKAGDAVIEIGQRHTERVKSATRMDFDNEFQGRKFAYELKERGKNSKEAQAASNLEENKEKYMPNQVVKDSIEAGRKFEASQSSALEGRGNNQRTAQHKTGQSTERKDNNRNESHATEDTERMKRERELEKERLRKLEEEREREREREKDRMAVDRVALETRERAYIEARERAERAAVERAIAEARERLEKACAEARDKSSTEARLRAERAAVERATAEARERAVEKAMAEKSAFEARERVERSVSDKFSSFSRNSGLGTSSSSSDIKDQQFRSTGSFSGSRYPYSSAYNGVEGESAQRYKARLERYRRTAERAARALAEKNTRDLIVQREQAERNRLAETLDADVKRWSSGKEGNLRALLSTLQYVCDIT